MSDQPILRIEDLCTYFKTGAGTARAVDGVTFAIRPGETYALVGESGCGKSVTALSILQLVAKPAGYIAGGKILFKGRDLTALPPIEMRKVRGNHISMIFQEPMTALNPVFTVGHQVAETIMLHRKIERPEADKKSIEMLERVGIPDPSQCFGAYPHQMSGGMRQRVMIAMALACRPELLIADEPTTALDVTIQAQILQLIRDLQKQLGTAVLLITHDMGVVHENADRIGVMYAGRIVENAGRTDIFTAPAHPYTQLLLRSLPSRSKRDRPLDTIKGMVPKATAFPPGCRFNNRCPLAMERCRREQPRSYAVGPQHCAECFLLEDTTTGKPAALYDQTSPLPPSALDTNTTRLEIRELKMHFPVKKGLFKRTVASVKAVDGVTLDIRKGETLALVGESGCGKTTVGKCLVRLLDPSGGVVLFHDREIQNLSRSAMKPFRRRIQMIFQDPFSSLNPRMTIGQTILEGMQTHGVKRSKQASLETARNLMFRVGLDPDMISRYPHEFSGGQRQRIGLARALAVEPELVICDEATSSLDVSVQAQILNLLKKLQSDLGLAYLFITHDLSVVKYLADRVAVMYLGRIVEQGTTGEIFDAAHHPYTRALLSAVPRIDEEPGRRSMAVAGDVPSPVNPPRGCHFHARCPHVRDECREHYPEAFELSATHKCRCVLCGDSTYSAAGGVISPAAGG